MTGTCALGGWVLDLARLPPGMQVLDAGCGNGLYLRGLRDQRGVAVGCDLAMEMLQAAAHPALLNADVTALRQVQVIIDDEGAFVTFGDLAAFVCR